MKKKKKREGKWNGGIRIQNERWKEERGRVDSSEWREERIRTSRVET